MAQRKQRRIKGEGSVYQRSDGLWVAKYEGKVLYAHNSYDAADNLQKLKNVAKAAIPDAKQITVDRVLRSFFAMKSSSIKPASQDRMESTIKCQIIPRIGSLNVSDLTGDMFFDLVLNKMKDEGLSYSSIKKAYDTFNAGMRYAVAQKIIARNPIEGYDSPTQNAYSTSVDDEDDGALFFIPQDKIETFVAASKSKYSNGNVRFKNGPAYILCLYTGLRMGELLALRWNNVDLEQHTIRVCHTIIFVKDRNPKSKTFGKKILSVASTTKTNQTRTLKLNTKAFDAISELKQVADSKHSIFVVSNNDGELVRPKAFAQSFRSICDIADISLPQGTNVHALRHTFASMLFAKGVQVKIVSALLGHSSVQRTMNTYIHLIQQQEAQAMDVIDI